MVQSHRPNIELIAAQALGTAIGIKLSTPVINRLEAYHAKPAATLTRRERQAEPSEKPTVKQPTLFNQRYSKSSLKTKALADTANGFSTPSPEEASLLKPIGSNDIIATLDASRGYWPEPRSSFDYAEAYGRGIGNAVANDARQFVTHNFLTNQGAEERFILMVETALFLNSSLSNKYEVLSRLAGNLVQGVETRYHQYQAADGLERAYMLGHDTEEAAKFLGGLLVGRGLFEGRYISEKFGYRMFMSSPKSAYLTEGIEPITTDLVIAMKNKGRLIDIAAKGSDDYKYLQHMGAEGSINTGVPNHILIKEDAGKSALLEEFLHGTQKKLGIIGRLTRQETEVHVKDFMIRHARLLGLNNSADLRLLEQLKVEEIERLQLTQQRGRPR